MWWKSSVWSIWRSRIGVEQIGSRCSFFVQTNIQRKLLKGGRIMKSSTFERLSCVMTRSHRFELCRRPRCSFLGWFRQVSCSTCANVNTCNLRKNHNDHPSCHRQLFQMMVFGQTISMMATPYAYITYIYIYIGISLRISCNSKPTFSWNQKNGSLIPSILFRGEKIGGLLSLTSSSYLTRWPQELRLMVKGLVGGFRFLVNSVTHGEST